MQRARARYFGTCMTSTNQLGYQVVLSVIRLINRYSIDLVLYSMGYLTQYVPALRDMVHSQIPTQYIVQRRLPSCSCLCWPSSRTPCRTVRMDGARCDCTHAATLTHTHTHTHIAHTRASPTHTHTALAPLVLPVSHTPHTNSFLCPRTRQSCMNHV